MVFPLYENNQVSMTYRCACRDEAVVVSEPAWAVYNQIRKEGAVGPQRYMVRETNGSRNRHTFNLVANDYRRIR